MAGRLETSMWNLTFVAAAAACGPTIPIDDAGDESFDEDGSDSIGDETPTTDPPCDEDGCAECRVDADCDPDEYCSPSGTCEYYYYCGVAGGDDEFRCSPPPYYECYSDADCPEDQSCEFYECVPQGCDVQVFQDTYAIPQPDQPVVDVAFVDRDGAAPRELAIATSTEVWIAGVDSPELVSVGVAVDIGDLAAADVDNDGDVDLVIADRGDGGQIVVLANDGTGIFVPQTPVASLGPPLELLLGDPENDGLVDAFVRNDFGIVRHVDLGQVSPVVGSPVSAMVLSGWSIAYSSGGQSWWMPVATLEPAEPSSIDQQAMTAYALANIDGDPDADFIGLLVENGSTRVVPWQGPLADQGLGTLLVGDRPIVAAADVDGDGLSEAVVAGGGEVLVLRRDPGSAEPFGCKSEPFPRDGVTLLAAGDYDGDVGEEIAISDGSTITMLDHFEGE